MKSIPNPMESPAKISFKNDGLRNKAIKEIDSKILHKMKNVPDDIKDIFHELQVYQIELELQNEELILSRENLEESRNRYQNLYDNAPLGYFTINKEGIIRNVNKMGTSLLKMEKAFLIDKRFQHFIDTQDKDVFFGFLRRVFSQFDKQACEVKLLNKEGHTFPAIVKGMVTENEYSFECLMAIIDITDRKKAEEIIKESIAEKERLNIILSTQEEERRRISEELHNGIAQLLYAAQLKLEVMMDNKKFNPDILKEAHTLIQECTNETRTISFDLMPSILKDFGLQETINELCKKKSNGNQEIFYTYSGPCIRLDNFIEIAVYRIIQELLNNVVKHSNAKRANVYCDILKNSVRICVEDNGKGFNKIDALGGLKKMGLRNIKNRVSLMNGIVDIKTSLGEGTRIVIEIPL